MAEQQATCVRESLPNVFISRIGLALLMSVYAAMPSNAQQKADVLEHGNGIVAEWDFSPVDQGVVLEKISGSHDPIAGIFQVIVGPVGPALLMDGYTTVIRHAPLDLFSHGGEFSVSCWLQIEAYPWNDLPILDQNGPGRDFFFGIDAEGHLIASVAGPTEQRKVTTVETLPLRQWTLVTLNLTGDGNFSFTVRGRSLATQSAPLSSTTESNSEQQPDLLIGHVRRALLPGPSTMIHPQLRSSTLFKDRLVG
jgi:hypothetical protein